MADAAPAAPAEPSKSALKKAEKQAKMAADKAAKSAKQAALVVGGSRLKTESLEGIKSRNTENFSAYVVRAMVIPYPDQVS